MLILLRLFILWVTVTLCSHSILAHFWLGKVAEETLSSGVEPNALRFYGFLVAFGISVYYFFKEMGEWKSPMPGKVALCTAASVAYLASLYGLESADQRHYEEQATYQKYLVAGRLGGGAPAELFTDLAARVPVGSSPGEALSLFPNSLPSRLVSRRDGSAYQNIFYWLGVGVRPFGVQVSYSPPPARVVSAEALPRSGPIPKAEEGSKWFIPGEPER